MKKMEWMVAAGTVAALAGAVYSAGCARTASDCALLGTCVQSGTGTGGSGGTSSSATSTTTASSSSASGSSTSTSTSSSSSSSSGTGGMESIKDCDARRFGDPANDQRARTIRVDATGAFLLAGDYLGTLSLGTKSVTAAGDSVFVANVDTNWNATTLKTFAVPYGAVVPYLAGGIVLAGPYAMTADLGCQNVLGNQTDLYVARLDATGTCLWAQGFIAPSAHVNLAVSTGGNIALAGDAQGTMDFDLAVPGSLPITGGPGGGRDLFLVELDANGLVLSRVAYGGAGDEVATGVAYDSTAGAILTGTFTSTSLDFSTGSSALKNPSGKELAFVARLGGNAQSWFTGFAGAGVQHPTALAVEGNVALLAGDFTDSLGLLKATDQDLFLIGLDTATGTLKWNHAYAGMGPKSIKAIATSAIAGGTVALTGAVDGDLDFGLGKLTTPGGFVVATFGVTTGKTLTSRAFGLADPALSANGISFKASDLLVAGAFSGMLDLGDMKTLESAGAADVFVTTLCPP